MKPFLIALQFLTIFPIKIKTEIKPEDFGKSLLFFPLVGLIIGLVMFYAAFAFNLLPALMQGSLLILLEIILTGGLHIDGFADTCDGFYGFRSREKALEIMRDSHSGVMAIIGVACLLLLKFSLFVSMPITVLCKTLIAMCVFSRWAQVLACYKTAYPRQDGKAKPFIEHVRFKDVFSAGVFVFILFISLLRLKGIIIFVLAFALILAFKQYVQKRIGGMTGDTIGATNEIAEAGVLFFSLIFCGGR